MWLAQSMERVAQFGGGDGRCGGFEASRPDRTPHPLARPQGSGSGSASGAGSAAGSD